MQIIESQKIYHEKNDQITFIRVQPINLEITISNIINSLNNLAWISNFDEDFLRVSFLERAKPTIEDIEMKLTSNANDAISEDAGEYVVSELSRQAIVKQMNYLDIPLSELFSKQKSGNPGFDFHTENNDNIILFGEAKYVKGRNAYGKGLEQVVKFINEKKDIKDLLDLERFCSKFAMKNAVKGKKGYAIGFSSKKTKSDKIIRGILKNKDFSQLLDHKELVMIAINL